MAKYAGASNGTYSCGFPVIMNRNRMEPQGASCDSVNSQLERILASPDFVNAGRLSRFLRFAVEETAAGRSEHLKEYVIGVEVYQRDTSFDPRLDAIVRVEAGRLRAKLQRYYATEGANDPIVISIPKGSYVPAVVDRTPVAAAGSAARLRPLMNAKGHILLATLLIMAGILYWMENRRRRESAAVVAHSSIAVLPLENLSADPEQEYFSDGMTDALITDLAKVRALRVISRTSALSYKRAQKPLPQIARELGVDYVVEGTVQRAGQRVRITAKLISLPAERHVWAESYERDVQDILTLQREMANVIARQVRVQLTPQDQARLASARPVKQEAYEAYLKGRYYQEQRTEEGLKKGLDYFRQAIAKDPANGLAYSGLADSHTYLVNHGYLPPREAGPQAKAMAEKALEVDSTLAEAHTSLAYIRMVYEWDFPGADVEFRRSIDLNPGYAKAHSLYACYFTAQRRFDEALAEIRRAVELDPLSTYDNANLGWHLLMARRYDEALDQFRKTVHMNPGSWESHHWLSLTLEQKQRLSEAIAESKQAMALLPDNTTTMAGLAHVYAKAGERSRAVQLFERMHVLASRKYAPPYDMAVVSLALGDKHEALAWLEKAYQERDGGLWLRPNVDPRLDSLRQEPQFHTIVENLHLQY